jgi:hypothetical protein
VSDNNEDRWQKWEEKGATKLIAKFPLGLGIIVLSVFEGFRELFSKEPPFTSMNLSDHKPSDKSTKE